MNRSEALITVIVPIYNVEKYLSRCIDSLLKQDFDEYIIILVDDCSTDCSAAIAQEYEKGNPDKILFIKRDTNGGLSAARNSGIKLAYGEWITFVDSDDWVHETYLSSLFMAACENNADVVMGNVSYIYDNGEMKPANPYGKLTNGAGKKEIIAHCRSYACGRLFRTKLFVDTDICFPEDIKRSEDIGTIIPILTYANKIALVDRVLYFYYQRFNSISNTNHDIDLSFYRKTLDRMFVLSLPGYENELEYRAIHEMLYGMVYLMIQSNKTKDEFTKHVSWFNNRFPEWRKNKYLVLMNWMKRLFVFMAGNKWYCILKVLVKAKKYRE